jgi:CheY-like chemotaxis protein
MSDGVARSSEADFALDLLQAAAVWLPLNDGTLLTPHRGTEMEGDEDPQSLRDEKQLEVIIVDASEDCAELLATLLSRFNHRVHVASDRIAALTLLETRIPDMVFLDLDPNSAKTHEVVRHFRSRAPLPCQLIALTPCDAPDVRKSAIAAVCDSVLVKPVLLRDVRSALAKQRRTRAL